MHQYDKSSKWLIQHHGGSILRLAGVRDIVSWQPLQAELVQPRRLPDGLIQGRRQGHAEPDLFILEIYTYPDARAVDQVVDDMILVYLDRRVVPEVLVLFLHPKGKVESVSAAALRSRRGWTKWQISWKVVTLWTVPAEELLAAGDVGLIPWVPLAQFDGPPEQIVRRCRERIDRGATLTEHENLLAVTQVLTGLRYNDPRLFQILGGRKAMIESPVLQELIAERTRETVIKDLIDVLVARFGSKAKALETELKGIDDDAQLRDLIKLAATSRTLGSFRKRLSS